MNKKIISLMIALIMVLSVIPLVQAVATGTTSNGKKVFYNTGDKKWHFDSASGPIAKNTLFREGKNIWRSNSAGRVLKKDQNQKKQTEEWNKATGSSGGTGGTIPPGSAAICSWFPGHPDCRKTTEPSTGGGKPISTPNPFKDECAETMTYKGESYCKEGDKLFKLEGNTLTEIYPGTGKPKRSQTLSSDGKYITVKEDDGFITCVDKDLNGKCDSSDINLKGKNLIDAELDAEGNIKGKIKAENLEACLFGNWEYPFTCRTNDMEVTCDASGDCRTEGGSKYASNPLGGNIVYTEDCKMACCPAASFDAYGNNIGNGCYDTKSGAFYEDSPECREDLSKCGDPLSDIGDGCFKEGTAMRCPDGTNLGEETEMGELKCQVGDTPSGRLSLCGGELEDCDPACKPECTRISTSKQYCGGYSFELKYRKDNGEECDPSNALDREAGCKLRPVGEDGKLAKCKEGDEKCEDALLYAQRGGKSAGVYYFGLIFESLAEGARAADALCGLWSIPTMCDNAWKGNYCRDDISFRGKDFLCGNWEQSLCQQWSNWDFSWFNMNQFNDLPNTPNDLQGNPVLWATAEYQPITRLEDFEETNTYIYRMNFQLNPMEICDVKPYKFKNPDEMTEEEKKEEENKKNKYFEKEFLRFRVFLKSGNSKKAIWQGDDHFLIRCDHGLLSYTGGDTLIRYIPSVYDSICIEFEDYNGNMNIKKRFIKSEISKGSPPLKDGIFCNDVVLTEPDFSTGGYTGSGPASITQSEHIPPTNNP